MSEDLVPHEDAPVPETGPTRGDDLDRPAVPLPPGAAEGLREFARMPEVRKGLGRLAGRKEPWTVVLDPSTDTRKALEAGELVLTKTKKGGQLLPQARSVKTGQVAENIPVMKGAAPAAKGAKAAKSAAAGAAVAWQAMAIATQQHYLVEISGRLSNIERGVADIVDRHVADKASELETTEDALGLVEEHITSGHPLTDTERQDVRAWHKSAHTTCDAQVRQARKILGDPERDPADALPDLLVADRAAQIAARCAAALLRMPPETPEKHLAQFWHYSDLTQELLDDVNELFTHLSDDLAESVTAWREYLFSSPNHRPKKAWNAGPGKTRRLHWGPQSPRFDGLRELPPPEKEFLRSRAELSREPGLQAVPATVILDGKEARVIVDVDEEAPAVAEA